MKRFPVAVLALAVFGHPAGGDEDRAGRRAVRGSAVAPSNESPELRELRQFEAAELGPKEIHTPGQGGEPRAPTPPWLAGLVLPDLPFQWEPHLFHYLEFYRNDRRGHAIIESWLRNQGRYRALIERALTEARLPHALLYVAMVESGYDPQDRSGAGAAGLWQLMPDAGRIYGLRIDHWLDERYDPEKATAAAMRYFHDLMARFDSWPLALAAYNAGYGAVLRAIAKYNTNDFWELIRHEDGLPWDTTLYVPKVIATAIVSENRSHFGCDKLPEVPPFDFDYVTVPSSQSLAVLARATGATAADIATLNPELRRGRTPPESYRARVPLGAGARFSAEYDRLRESLQTYAVRFGDRIEQIAHRFGMTARELREMNGIDDPASVRPGSTLLVTSERKPRPQADEPPTIVAVADQQLDVPGRKRLFYRPAPGDTVRDIARFFQIASSDIERWNRLDASARLQPKMVIELWVAPDFDESSVALLDPAKVRLVTVGSEEFFDQVEARAGRKRLAITVRPRETLKQIAVRYHCSEANLERINRLPRTTVLHPGQRLTVYVPMSATERAAANRGLLASMAPLVPTSFVDDDPGVDRTPSLPRPPLLPRAPQVETEDDSGP